MNNEVTKSLIVFMFIVSLFIVFKGPEIQKIDIPKEEMQSKTVISDLAYDKTGSIKTVFVLEEDKYIPYYVLTNKYLGEHTLLVRQESAGKFKWNSQYDKPVDYERSEIDLFLVEDFYPRLKLDCDIQEVVISGQEVHLAEQWDASNGGLHRKVFLLSAFDIYGYQAYRPDRRLYYLPSENRLNFFKNKYCFEKIYGWTRTRVEGKSDLAVAVDKKEISFKWRYSEFDIFPAFCISGDTPVYYLNEAGYKAGYYLK